jgi:hypothetical protein
MFSQSQITRATNQPTTTPVAETLLRIGGEHEVVDAKRNPLTIQPKLTIGRPDDSFEKEADMIVHHVMRTPESRFHIQRKCAACEHEEQIQRKPFDITPFIQKSGPDGGGLVSEAVSSQVESSRGGGSPMAEKTRTFMESRFGQDFSGVRIHTDFNGIQLSQNLNAQAFTVGNDVFFNQGKYDPEGESGRHLLAHELTHTIQQSGSNTIQRRVSPHIGKINAHLSYGLFDWAIRDSDVRAVLHELKTLSDPDLTDTLNAMGRGKVNRLFDNLAESRDRNEVWVGELMARVQRLGDITPDMDTLKGYLSYGVFDWAITDSDVAAVLLYLRNLDEDTLRQTVKVMDSGGYIDRLFANLAESDDKQQAWVETLVERMKSIQVREKADEKRRSQWQSVEDCVKKKGRNIYGGKQPLESLAREVALIDMLGPDYDEFTAWIMENGEAHEFVCKYGLLAVSVLYYNRGLSVRYAKMEYLAHPGYYDPENIEVYKQTRKTLETQYAITIERGDKDWSPHDIVLLKTALQQLSESEVQLLKGYHFVRSSYESTLTYSGLHSSVAAGKLVITLYDGYEDKESENGFRNNLMPGVNTILHEIGHAMHLSRLTLSAKKYFGLEKEYKRLEPLLKSTSTAQKERAEQRLPVLQKELSDAEVVMDRDMEKAELAEFVKLTRGKKALTEYSKTDSMEAFSEAFMLFKVDPKGLEKRNKKLFEWFSRGGFI